MNSAELYENRNSSQFNDSASVLNQFKSKLQWQDNETIMDVGCGPGNVTAKLLQPLVPNDARIVSFTWESKSHYTVYLELVGY
ncbi:hypothetical protein LSTR_LSTR017592, partial [Laodelphax striatellus]